MDQEITCPKCGAHYDKEADLKTHLELDICELMNFLMKLPTPKQEGKHDG